MKLSGVTNEIFTFSTVSCLVWLIVWEQSTGKIFVRFEGRLIWTSIIYGLSFALYSEMNT